MEKMSAAAIRSELTIAQQQGTLVEIYNLGVMTALTSVLSLRWITCMSSCW